jgi:hypothetical protein
VRGALGLLGFASRHAPSAPDSQPGADSTRPGPRYDPFSRQNRRGAGMGGGRAFSLLVNYTSNRNRADTGLARQRSGQQMVTLAMTFSPTAHWTASWRSAYDFGTRQFADHYLNFERDLRRWRASFVFSKSANGNFAFSFNIALIDQSDIKFDYDQRTFARP